MIPVVIRATKLPIQSPREPIIAAKEPIVPRRVDLPIALSAGRRGSDQRKRNPIQSRINTPPIVMRYRLRIIKRLKRKIQAVIYSCQAITKIAGSSYRNRLSHLEG